MPKNIVILCDGTSNQIEEDRTNILRLYGCLAKNGQQIVYYDPGVGSFGGDNAWRRFTSKTAEILGLAFGAGLDDNVKQAYRFLVEHYNPGRGASKNGPGVAPDRIYIFGFSRGAYTARVLAGFIHTFGLMDRTQLNLLDYAYRTYKGISDFDDARADETSSAFDAIRYYERTLAPTRPTIRALGLFDTVSSVIEPGKYWFWPRLKTYAFTNKNPNVEHVRHAVAIDERRTMFNPKLWPKDGEFWGRPVRPAKAEDIKAQDVKEVWFSGVHGDVGGGYDEEQSAQAKYPLLWMIEEMKELGLDMKTRTVNTIVLGKNQADRNGRKYVAPGVEQPLNTSMNRVWAILEFLPRRIPATSWRMGGKTGCYFPLCDRRLIPPGAAIHESVHERMQTDPDYRPPNLP